MNNIIKRDSCSLLLPDIGRRAYVNSSRGRIDLTADLTDTNPELLREVFAVWGETPTVPDNPASAKTFNELKTEKIYTLESAFDGRVAGSFVCSQGYPMQFNRSDTIAVEGAIQLLKATEQTTGYLTDANDVTHYGVPLATMEAVKVEMLAAYAACHARKQELRAAINAAKTVEDLDAIKITWPL